MPTNIFFENLNKEEIIQILRMFEAREEKLQHQIEKLKKKIHAQKETDLAPQEKEQLMKFLQLVPLMDPQELKKESRAFLDIISAAWQDEVLLSNMQRRIQNLQKVKEEILKTDITFQSFGKKNCPHRFVETDTGLKCICCGHSTDEYQLSIHEFLYLVEAAKMQGILIRHACIKEIPFLENLAYEQKILKAEDQDKISAKQYEKELIVAREQDLRKVKTPYLNTKESVRFFKKIESEKKAYFTEHPQNLEQQAINLVGKTIFEKLVKGYTEKQWGKKCSELPSFIIKRLPVRFTFDNNYFNDRYQGIPIGGYTKLVENMLKGIEVRLNEDFNKNKEQYLKNANKIIYTGAIDEYFDYCYGALEYRSVRFETKVFDTDNYQGNAVINYTDSSIPYTRVIEHKHFEFGKQEKTVVSWEYSSKWQKGDEPYYPINDERNNELYNKYKTLADSQDKVLFGGRLGNYKYYDMHNVIREALNLVNKELQK